MNDSPSLIIVEDESIVALDLRQQLTGLGYRVLGTAASGVQAIRMLEKGLPSLILMDVRLQGDVDGIEVAATIRRQHDIPVIFLTSHSDDDTVQRAARTAPYGYLTKPFQIRELRAGIEVALMKAQLERQLREADRWFAHTLQCVSDGIIVTDIDGRVRFINPTAERLTGHSLDTSLGRDIGEIVRVLQSPDPGAGQQPAPLPAHRREAMAMVRAALQLGRPTPVSYGLEITARDGRTWPVDESVGPVIDDRGKALGAVLVLHDASERVAQEALLRQSEERFRSAFDHAPLGMALVALSGAVLQVNGAFCRMLNAAPDALTRLNHRDLGVATEGEHETQRLRKLIDGAAKVVQYERSYRRHGDGAMLPVLVSASLLHEDGNPTCHLMQVHDLSDQKRAAEQLAQLAEERLKRRASELADTAKSEFLSRVSHEMRTPLNAVIGFSTLLQMSDASAESRTGAYAKHIKSAGEHLLAMVTDLLDLNRIATGELRMTPAPVNLAASVDLALKMLGPLSQAHGIDMQSNIDAGLVVHADPVRLQQILLNVGSNAIKYNRAGGSVRLRAGIVAPGRVRLSVQDDGVGMTAEQLERLFQPFERLGQELSQTPGTGLGLVIVRGLAVQMGGALDIISKPGAGTTVHIEIPTLE